MIVDYDIRYRSSAEHCKADSFSRLHFDPDLAFHNEESVS